MKLSRALEAEILSRATHVGQSMQLPTETPKRSKYGNVKVKQDQYVFDSKKEARRYGELLFLLNHGVIRDLEVHPKFVLHGANGAVIGRFTPDFAYTVICGSERVVEDVKSEPTRKTAAYRLRRKMFESEYAPLVIREV